MLFHARKPKHLISYQPQSFRKHSAKKSLPRSLPHASARAARGTFFNNNVPLPTKLACSQKNRRSQASSGSHDPVACQPSISPPRWQHNSLHPTSHGIYLRRPRAARGKLASAELENSTPRAENAIIQEGLAGDPPFELECRITARKADPQDNLHHGPFSGGIGWGSAFRAAARTAQAPSGVRRLPSSHRESRPKNQHTHNNNNNKTLQEWVALCCDGPCPAKRWLDIPNHRVADKIRSHPYCSASTAPRCK